MLNPEEKKKQWELFKNSDKFGHSTYFVLGIFQLNTKIILNTIRVYDILATKLEEKINFEMSQKGILGIKHQITLDLVGKLMSLIESTLMLFHAVSKGYSEIPTIITYYPTSMLDQVIDDFIEKKYNMRKILGLAELEKLNLDNDERKILSICYQETGKDIENRLKEWAEFYKKLRIIYGKSRHGLSYLMGIGKELQSFNDIPNYEDSLIVAFDRKDKSKLPPNTIAIDPKNEKKNDPWFDIQSWLKIKKTYFNSVGKILHEMEEIIPYVIENHLLYAENCGEDYLPIKIHENRIDYGVFYGSKQNDEDEKTLSKISERIGKNMLIAKRQFGYSLVLDNKKLIDMMDNDEFVINFWFGKGPI